MELPFMKSVETIVFEAVKKVYNIGDRKTEIWIKTKFGLRKYFENLAADLNEVHIHRSDTIYHLESIYVETKLLRTVLSERYYIDIDIDKLVNNDPDSPYRNVRQLIRENVKSQDIIGREELLNSYDHAVILGLPGAGKSTLLKRIAIEIMSSNECNQIPIYLPLRDSKYLKNGLFDLIVSSFDQNGIEHPELLIESLLKDGKLIFLLDGLDEISPKVVTERIEEILAFSKKYKKNKCYVTCRTDAYRGQLSGFRELEIDQFDTEQVEEFVNNILRDSKSNANELIAYINDIPQLSEISSSPLLLSLICIVFERDLHIPSRRSTLFKRCIECLIRDWDAQRNFRRESQYSKFDEEKKISLLSYVAFKMHCENKIYFQHQDVERHIDEVIEKYGIDRSEVKAIIDEVKSQTGIVVQVSKDYIAFSHLALQEYLVARYLCDSGKLIPEACSRYMDPFWQEVFVLSAAILSDATQYLNSLVELSESNVISLLLAGLCLSVDPVADRDLKEGIVRRLVYQHFNNKEGWSHNALRVLARVDKTFVGTEISRRLGLSPYVLNKIQ